MERTRPACETNYFKVTVSRNILLRSQHASDKTQRALQLYVGLVTAGLCDQHVRVNAHTLHCASVRRGVFQRCNLEYSTRGKDLVGP